ncbi:MAG: hypothetical protein LLG09_01230 [Negativicutes bacterium]|nr:hypothetical protein [Negativicutes bacterium]
MKSEFEVKKKFTMLEVGGFLFLVSLCQCISGSLFVFFVFRYFGISVFVPFTRAYSCGSPTIFLAELATVPLAVSCFLQIPFFLKPTSKKWLYFPIAVALTFLATKVSESYVNSRLAPYLAIGLGVALLLLSYRLLNAVKKTTVVWVVFLAFTLAFTSLNIMAATQLRNTFTISVSEEGSYARLLTIDDRVYLVRCEVLEADGKVVMLINQGDYKIVDRQEAEDLANDAQVAVKTIQADLVSVSR